MNGATPHRSPGMNAPPQSAGYGATVSALVLLVSACGGSDGNGTGPPESPQFPAVVGDTIFVVDLANRLSIFGSGSLDELSRTMPIQGLPPGHRIVGTDWRTPGGELYAVGTDSRVYILDTRTAVATPVNDTPFTPAILPSFDIHFGMAYDSATDRIRLMSAESGLNWSIDPDDGTAVMGAKTHYAAGDPGEGSTPRVSGLAFGPPLTTTELAALSSSSTDCDRVLYALDPDVGRIVGTCDPDLADFVSLVDTNPPGAATATRCAEIVRLDGFAVEWAVEVISYFQEGGGENRLTRYEKNEDGEIVSIARPIPELASPAQSVVWKLLKPDSECLPNDCDPDPPPPSPTRLAAAVAEHPGDAAPPVGDPRMHCGPEE